MAKQKVDPEQIAHALRESGISTEDATRLLLGAQPEVVVRGRFPAGTRVELQRRTGDTFAAGANEVVDTATVSKDSEVKFEGLEPGGRYWVAAEVDDEWRWAAVTAKLSPVEKQRTERPDSISSRPAQVDEPQDKPRSVPKGVGSEPQPSLKQEDVPATQPQRSSTPTGEATPKDPDEFIPTPSQRTVKPNTPQRSSTEFGEAAIKDDEGVLKQEDAPKGLKQRVTGETGQAFPKPDGDAVTVRKVRDASDTKARGGNFNQAAERGLDESGDGTSKKKDASGSKSGKNPEKRLGKTPEERLDAARQS